MKYAPFYIVPILIAVIVVLIIRTTTRSEPSIAGYPICSDTGKNVTLDIVTHPQAKISTHPRCWSGWIAFSQSNFNWSADHETRTLEFYFQNGVRETGATGGTLKKYPGGAFRLRGEEGITTVTLVDPRSVPKTADSPRGAKWETQPRPAPLPPPPVRVEPLPAPKTEPGAAAYRPLPPEQPKQEPGASAYRPLQPEPLQRDSGAASFRPLPSSPSQAGR